MQTFTAVKNTQHIMILITNVNVEFGCIHRYRLFESIESKYVCKFDIYCLWNPFRKKALFQFTFRICNWRTDVVFYQLYFIKQSLIPEWFMTLCTFIALFVMLLWNSLVPLSLY